MKNVYSMGAQLISILREVSAKEVGKGITAKGEVVDIPQNADLREASIYVDGTYNDTFVQAALGGLIEPPKYIKNQLVYKGTTGAAVVVPQGNGVTKVQTVFAANYLGNDYTIEPPNRIGPGKTKDLDKNDPNDDREDNGPGGANQADGNTGKDLLNQADDLEEMGGSNEVPETLSIADDSQLSGVKQIVIKWDAPQLDGTIDDIKALFGEGSVLPVPTSLVIDTGEETISSKRNASTIELRNFLKKTKVAAKKDAYYGLSPKMESTCGKCGSRMSYNGQTGEVSCSVCKNKYKYEGHAEGAGVAGQTNPS